MKMVIAIVSDRSDAPVLERLAAEGYGVTRVASTGGFMRRGNVTLFIGVPDEREQTVIDLLRNTCCPPEAGQRRATLFVLDARHFEQI
jgi:uncharacterized protein YaaQ